VANTGLVTSGMPFSLSLSAPATRDTVAATLALFDGDADEATVVAPLVALRQDPVWILVGQVAFKWILPKPLLHSFGR